MPSFTFLGVTGNIKYSCIYIVYVESCLTNLTVCCDIILAAYLIISKVQKCHKIVIQ